MRCPMCGQKNMIADIGTHRYDVGLDEKVILVGVEIRKCPDCGDVQVGINNTDELHQKIAEAVAMKPDRLTPKELTFLRRHLEMENEGLAELMGVTTEQARRWQREKGTPIPIAEERLLRVSVLGRADIATLTRLAVTGEVKPLVPRMRPAKNKHWELTA